MAIPSTPVNSKGSKGNVLYMRPIFAANLHPTAGSTVKVDGCDAQWTRCKGWSYEVLLVAWIYKGKNGKRIQKEEIEPLIRRRRALEAF